MNLNKKNIDSDVDFKKYEDMLYMQRPVIKGHIPMKLIERGAQFAPFSALTGHDKAVEEVARYTDKTPEFSEDWQNVLDFKLSILLRKVPGDKEVKIKYFIRDKNKQGGRYLECKGVVEAYMEDKLYMSEGEEIKINDIVDIDIDIFP